MKKQVFTLCVVFTVLISACNNSSDKSSAEKNDTTSQDGNTAALPAVDSTTLLLAELRTKTLDTAYQLVGDVHADTLTYTGADFGDVLHLAFTNSKGETFDFVDDLTDGDLYKDTKNGIEANKALVNKKFIVGWRQVKKKTPSTNDGEWYFNEMTQIIYLKKFDN